MDNSVTQVSLLTARGMSAIASVALTGPGASDILSAVFRPSGFHQNADHPVDLFQPGRTIHGSIVDGTRLIDEVLIGCELSGSFVVHCHGNPLLAEQVVKLFQRHGAVLITPDCFMLDQYRDGAANLIEAEAKLALSRSATLYGAKILKSQIHDGLSKWIGQLSPAIGIDELKQQCRKILQRSSIATRIINGVRIVIAGAPNSGKSTLLNALAGDQQVIVSDTAGTTRDWVSVTCQIGPIHAEFIDTAGLDELLASTDEVEQSAQQMTRELLNSCDLILHLRDASTGKTLKTEHPINSDKPMIEVFNKCDLLQEYRATEIRELKSQVSISAKENVGIDRLIESILKTLQVEDYSVSEPIVFTQRQYAILSCLLDCDSQSDSNTIIENFQKDMMSQQEG